MTGLPSQLVCTDNAGWEPIQSLVDEGIIIPFKVTSQRKYLIQTLSKLSQGYWPENPKDTLSPLLPPEKGLSEVAARFFDSITTTCDLIMEVHQNSITVTNGVMNATNVRVPEMPKDSFIVSGEGADAYARRFTGRSDYQGVQQRIEEFIRNTSMLPVPVIWTALEVKGEDQDKRPIYGPQFIGKALTGICGPWFGNMIHLDFLPVMVEAPDPTNPAGGKIKAEELRPFMFLKRHFDPKDPLKIPYPAKVRAPRTLYAKVPLVAPPDLAALYRFLDSLREEERASRKKVESPQPVGASK